MAQRLLSIVLLVILFSSCRPGMTALEYSNQMSTITDSLFAKGKRWGDSLVKLMPEKRFAELKPLRIDMMRYIDSTIDVLQKQGDVKGSEAFKQSMLGFMNFEKEYVEKACSSVEAMNEATTDEEVRTTLQEVLSWADKEETHLINVRKEQAKYAGKNGFKIGGTKQAN